MGVDQTNGSRLLEVDLSSGQSKQKVLDAGQRERFIGGGGLNGWLLWNMTGPDTDPLGPENPLIFGAGPLVGTGYPTGARTTATALSPLTGIFGDSNAGGLWGVLMQSAGVDHLVITGALNKPGYLLVGSDGHCSINDAADLWGLSTGEAERVLKARHPRSIAAVIGPAGENLVRYANITFESNAHSFARSGMGAVMGSKKLKAVVITRGGQKARAHDPQGLKAQAEKVKSWAKNLAFPRLFTKYGTMMFIHTLEALGLMYADNWRRHAGFDDITPVDTAAYLQAVDSKDTGCYRCPLRCGKHWRIRQGDFAGEEGHGYEVAYIMTLGLTLGLRDVSEILHLANLINQKGFDINEFSGAAGMLTDACGKDIISAKTMDGLTLRWGDVQAYEQLIELVAANQGVGEILALGTKRAAARIGRGAESYALHMKGMHWPAHSAPPFVLAFSLSPRGGDFLKGVPHLLLQQINAQASKLLFGGTKKTMNFASHADKGRAVWWHENYKLILDSLGICFYLGMALLNHGKLVPAHLAEAWRAASGTKADGRDIQLAAERSYQLMRAINTLRGRDRRHDSFTRRPEPDSWARGIDLNRKGMLDEYYAYRGLTSDGLPTAERLTELGLGEVAQRLEAAGRLGRLANPADYRPLTALIKDPSPKKFNNGLKMKIQNRVRAKIMAHMAEDPQNLRQRFKKIGDKRRRKQPAA
jgi:aldehyde:ferredoxin oxidoreductase